MMKPRDYQLKLAEKGADILKRKRILYLALEMRVGKTLISLLVAKKHGAKSVLFVTPKKAMSSIQSDYDNLDLPFKITIINPESLHKLTDWDFDLVVVDEAHGLGAFPKANKRAKDLRNIVKDKPLILLSGTPTPESYSQIYHQLWISLHSPFGQWPSFYKWAQAGFVNPQLQRLGHITITNYSQANKDVISQYVDSLMLSYTQKDAKFTVTELRDQIDIVRIDERIHQLVKLLLRDRMYTFKDGTQVLCETAVKLQQKIHQVYSGTLITEEGTKVLDESKMNWIEERYICAGKKIAIFYLYNEEGRVIKSRLGEDIWTDSPDEFNANDEKIFVSQFQSGSRGINLSSADVIIFYNIHFSSELYQQARQRGQEKGKKNATQLVWLFAEGGIEEKIYKRVIDKQSYTKHYFTRDYLRSLS